VSAPKQVAIIGAALDLGSGRRGVDMGPSAIRYAGLHDRLSGLDFDVLDWSDVETAVLEATEELDTSSRYLPEIKAACGRVANLVGIALAQDALAKARGAGGVLWIDAHGDLNTPDSSPSGNVHGMPLAAAMGLGDGRFESDAWILPAVDPHRVALVGLRSLDVRERERIRELGIKAYTMSDIDRIGIERAIRESLTHIAGPGFVHVSLDMDALDPEVAPGVGTPVRGGLSYREAHLALELVSESGLAGSFEVVEVNPILDRENATAALAVELVASALGKTIL
jgi:arginase